MILIDSAGDRYVHLGKVHHLQPPTDNVVMVQMVDESHSNGEG